VAYKLFRLAAGSYDVLLNGVIIASLTRDGFKRVQPGAWNSWSICHLVSGQSLSQTQSTRSAA
jgi:hypothetical protein